MLYEYNLLIIFMYIVLIGNMILKYEYKFILIMDKKEKYYLILYDDILSIVLFINIYIIYFYIFNKLNKGLLINWYYINSYIFNKSLLKIVWLENIIVNGLKKIHLFIIYLYKRFSINLSYKLSLFTLILHCLIIFINLY